MKAEKSVAARGTLAESHKREIEERINEMVAEKKALAEAIKQRGVEFKTASSGSEPVLEWL